MKGTVKRYWTTDEVKEYIQSKDKEIERLESVKKEAHDHLAEILNRYKSLMTSKINERTQEIINRLK